MNLGTVFLIRLACGNLGEVVLPILKVTFYSMYSRPSIFCRTEQGSLLTCKARQAVEGWLVLLLTSAAPALQAKQALV